jgi:hypothetical protein
VETRAAAALEIAALSAGDAHIARRRRLHARNRWNDSLWLRVERGWLNRLNKLMEKGLASLKGRARSIWPHDQQNRAHFAYKFAQLFTYEPKLISIGGRCLFQDFGHFKERAF